MRRFVRSRWAVTRILPKHKTVIFVDGDFWHGRDLDTRLAKLRAGHNAPYWVKKIEGNVARDLRNTAALEQAGWRVLRFWEGEIVASPAACAVRVAHALVATKANP